MTDSPTNASADGPADGPTEEPAQPPDNASSAQLRMAAAAHPWLADARAPACPSLSPVERIYTFMAGNTARGHTEALVQDWLHLPAEAEAGGIEVVLQTHLFSGYPRTINGLAAIWSSPRPPAAALSSQERTAGNNDPSAPHPRERWLAAGEKLCAMVYGPQYPALRRRIGHLHPDFDCWMVEWGYGRVLSRPGLTPRERELCVLAALAPMDVPPQLESHRRGALRAGATAAEVAAVLEQQGLFET